MSRHCRTCTCDEHPLPRLDLAWRDHWWIERRVVVAMMLDHLRGDRGRGPYAEWEQRDIAIAAQLMYRQVANGLVRLVRSGWVDRVGRGLYRLTPGAVDTMRRVVRPGGQVRNFDVRTR